MKVDPDGVDVAVDDFERDQLIVGGVAAGDEEERGIAAIDNFGIWELVSRAKPRPRLISKLTLVLEKVAHSCPTSQYQLRDIFDNLRLVLWRQRGKPFG